MKESTTQPTQTGMVVEPLESPRHLTWFLLRDPETLDQQERLTLTFIREGQAINITYELAQQFFTMVRQRQVDRLDTWLEECLSSGIPDLQTFADGLKREYSALRWTLTFSYSNGSVEGQINRLMSSLWYPRQGKMRP